jgi:hypothetical protein
MSQPSKTGSTTPGSANPRPASSKTDTTKASGSGGYGGTQPGSGPISRNLNAYNPRGPPSASTYLPSKPATSVYPPRDTAEEEKTQLEDMKTFMEEFHGKKQNARNEFGSKRWEAFQPPKKE